MSHAEPSLAADSGEMVAVTINARIMVIRWVHEKEMRGGREITNLPR